MMQLTYESIQSKPTQAYRQQATIDETNSNITGTYKGKPQHNTLTGITVTATNEHKETMNTSK